MASGSSRIGVVRIEVGGEWDVENLLALAEGLSESYGLFYPLVAVDEETRDRLQDMLRKQFWSGDLDSRHFGRQLYRAIPSAESLKLKSFSYSSPGTLEIVGVLAAILMLSRVARSWIKTGDEFLTLWERVDKFFAKRKNLRRPPRKFALDDDMALSSDEARGLVYDVGAGLGFDALSCDRLIGVIGNPIAALKYLVASGNEGRRLSELESAGLVHLPEPGAEAIEISNGHNQRRRRIGPGTEVVTKRSRKRPKKKQGRASVACGL